MNAYAAAKTSLLRYPTPHHSNSLSDPALEDLESLPLFVPAFFSSVSPWYLQARDSLTVSLRGTTRPDPSAAASSIPCVPHFPDDRRGDDGDARTTLSHFTPIMFLTRSEYGLYISAGIRRIWS